MKHRIPMPRRTSVKQVRALCIAVVGLWVGGAAWAIDLHQVYEAAVLNDAIIRASRAGAEATRERLPQAEAQRRPQVSLAAGRNSNNLISETRIQGREPIRSDNNYYSGNQTLTVRQAIYRPYANASVRQAEAQVDDANATLARDEQTLVTRVGEAYFNALLAEDQLALISAQKSTYATQLDAARKGLEAGSGTRTDIDEAQARLDLTMAQELEVRQNVDFTRRGLEVLTNGDLGTLAKLNVEQFSPTAPVPARVEEWTERAIQASPEIASLRAQVEIARQEVEKNQAGHLPTLDLVAQWARSQSDSVTNVNSRYDNKAIGLQLTVPIYSGGYVSSTVRQAIASQTRAEEALEATRRDLGVRVHREFRGMTEGVLRISALQQAVRSADQALLSNQKSFQAGSRTTLDVLNAAQQKTSALRDLAQARYVYLVSQMRLQSLAGEDMEMTVSQVNNWLRP